MTSACMGEREEVQEDGLVRKHAYSVLSVHEFMHLETIQKLVRLRNPWGKTEWKLEWADGTKEWTDELRQKLSHKDKKYGDTQNLLMTVLLHQDARPDACIHLSLVRL